MSRLAATLRNDVRLQLRYGFYWAGAVVALVWIAILSQVPAASVRVLIPALLFLNGTITTYFFVAGLVLFEKREGVLEALVATPLPPEGYLASKVVTLTGLAAVETLAIVLLGWGADFQLAPVVAGVVLLGVVFVLVGFLVIFRYDSINEFLLPGSLVSTVLQLPVFSVLGFWKPAFFWLWPTTGPLMLLSAGFDAVETPRLVAAVALSLVWISALGWLVRRSFLRFIVRGEGAR